MNGSDLGGGGQTTQHAYDALPEEDVRQARRVVAGRARNADELAEFLDMLGLREDPS